MKKVPKLCVVFQMKFRHIFIPFISLNIVYLFLHLLADIVPSSNQIVDRTGSLDNQNQFFLISGHACAKRGELYVVWARVAEKIWPKVLNSLKCTLGWHSPNKSGFKARVISTFFSSAPRSTFCLCPT